MTEYKLRKRLRVKASPRLGLKSSWVEWQVLLGRYIVHRADLEEQARQWIADNPL